MSNCVTRGKWAFEYIKFRIQGTHVYPPDVSMAGGDDMGTDFGGLSLLHTGLCVFVLREDRHHQMKFLIGWTTMTGTQNCKSDCWILISKSAMLWNIRVLNDPKLLRGRCCTLRSTKGANYFYIFMYLNALSNHH